MLEITSKNYKTYLFGSIFLATGGGLPFSVSQKIMKFIFRHKKTIKIYGLDEISRNVYLASVYGVGDPSKAKPGEIADSVKIALKKFKKLTGINIAGVIPGEIGAEASSFLAASFLDLPIVDSDLVGGRAAPEIKMDVFSVASLKITPVMGFASNKKTILLKKNMRANEIEAALRPFFAKNGGSGTMIGYLIKNSIYRKFAMRDTLSLALRVGDTLETKDMLKLKQITKAKKIIAEKIVKTDLKSGNGFLQGEIIFENYEILVKNENIILTKKDKKIARAPESIIIIDENFKPIHNTEIGKRIGQKVFIIVLPAMGYWKSAKGGELWRETVEKFGK